jgi:hypothetical protein
MQKRSGMKWARGSSGAAALEFALVFPLFLFLFLGLIAWGSLFMVQHNLSYAVQEGARAGMRVDPAAFSDADYETEVKSAATEKAEQALEGLPDSWQKAVELTANIQDEGGESWLQVTGRYGDAFPLDSLDNLVPMPSQLTSRAEQRL